MLLYIQENGFWTPLIDYTHNTNTHPLLGLIMSILLTGGAKSIFIFRLPSLLSALAALFAADRLNNNEHPAYKILLPLFIVSIPLFFDYLVLERGYPLGLAFILWGILSYNRSIWLTAFLFSLAVFTIPIFALDVLVVCLALGICIHWRDAIKTLLFSGVFSIAFYSLMFKDTVEQMLMMQGGTSVTAVLGEYFAGLSAIPWIGLILFAIATFFALKNIREKNFLDVVFLLSICTLPLGFARAHLLTTILMILILFREVRAQFILPTFIFCALSLHLMSWDTITSAPDQKPFTGYSYARQLTDCLSTQDKGVFVTAHAFYEKIQKTETPLRAGCPDFLMVDEAILKIPPSLRLYPELLERYGVSMYKRADLVNLVKERAAQ